MQHPPFSGAFFLTFTVAILGFSPRAAAQIGSVVRAHHIDELIPVVDEDSYLGSAVAALGDLDGDGIGDLALGAPTEWEFFAQPTKPGSVWILFLDASGAPRSQLEITRGTAGFTAPMVDGDQFGAGLCTIGDLDGDGLPELAVTSANGGVQTVFVLFLKTDGSVRTFSEIRFDDPVFGGAIQSGDGFGAASAVGDLDGDGVRDLAIGATRDDDGPGLDTGALWLTYMNSDGTAKSAKKISMGHAGFTGPLPQNAYFGGHAAPLGDLDGDGFADLAVTSSGNDLNGAVWILFLDANQDVLRTREILSDEFFPRWRFVSFTSLGDLDGDGHAEIATGSHDFFVDRTFPGAITIGFLAADGSLRKQLFITEGVGGLGTMPSKSGFGWSLASMGDMNGDGSPELAVGALYDGRNDHGGAWVLSLGTSAIRNGSGVNPLTLTESGDPVLGQTWNVTLDCSAHASGIALVSGWSRALAGTLLAQGELLVDPSSTRLFVLTAPHTGGVVPFAASVPLDASLVGLTLFTQGLSTGAPGARLSNALDVIVGR